MEMRPLGTTGLQVSVLALGTMTFGDQNSEAEGHAQLDFAVDHGINLVDTSEYYPVPPRRETQGATETILGTWLKNLKNRRKVLVATKAAGPILEARINSGHIRSGNNRHTRANLEAALDASLRRLQVDSIDLYQLHWPDRHANFFGHLSYEHRDEPQTVPIEETLRALDGFVRAGKVRYIGVSNETAWGIAQYLKIAERENLARIASVQNPYNLLNRSFDVGCAEFSLRDHVSLLAYSPLAFGVLTGKYLGGARPPGARLTNWERFARYNGEQTQLAVRDYVDLARRHGLDPAQMALAFIVQRRVVTSALVGATTLDQLKTNIGSLDLKLTPEILAEIEKVHARSPNPAP